MLDYGDSLHEIVEAVSLQNNGVLHRYTNKNGVECSSIYVNNEEIWWHHRSEESRMIEDWNKQYSKSGLTR